MVKVLCIVLLQNRDCSWRGYRLITKHCRESLWWQIVSCYQYWCFMFQYHFTKNSKKNSKTQNTKNRTVGKNLKTRAVAVSPMPVLIVVRTCQMGSPLGTARFFFLFPFPKETPLFLFYPVAHRGAEIVDLGSRIHHDAQREKWKSLNWKLSKIIEIYWKLLKLFLTVTESVSLTSLEMIYIDLTIPNLTITLKYNLPIL